LEFNLIVIHEPGVDNYSWVRNYIKQLLGDKVRYVSAYQSVILYLVDEPHTAAKLIRESVGSSSTPIIRVIPVDYVTDPEVGKVVEAVKSLSTKIPPNETFRITLEGHLYRVSGEGFLERMHTIEAIRELASYVDRPVNLDNPQWIIYIRVVKFRRIMRRAAISLLKPEELRRLEV